jgi:hypothetical protein
MPYHSQLLVKLRKYAENYEKIYKNWLLIFLKKDLTDLMTLSII